MATIEDHDGLPVFVTTIGGWRYSFTVLGFPPERYDWLCEVLDRQMMDIHDRAVYSTSNAIKADIRRALGIEDVKR